MFDSGRSHIEQPFQEESVPRAIPQYRYDVFISYSRDNADWVWNWLLPRLKAAELTICLDDESFEPGAPVVEEIERAVRESRRTLAVLSPAWVDGEWSRFESLLVNRQDPNARWRRLIPLLIEPCEPPDRIRLLNWVDLTVPETCEEQFERVVAAIQGRSPLPELRPDAFPEPRQRRWELRWYATAGVAALVTLGVLVAWIVLQQRGPTSMPEGDFNVAVAEFRAVDEAGRPISSKDAVERARSVASFLLSQADPLQKVLEHKVNVWGPEHHIGVVAADDESSHAASLNADVLVYGILRRTGEGRWAFEPEFYLRDASVANAAELAGRHALGAPISYRAGSLASEGDVNREMSVRLRALAKIVMGLSYYAAGNRDDFRRAVATFQEAAADPEWGAAVDDTGQEVLYLFLGNAQLKESQFLVDDPPARATLLADSQSAFRHALELNPEYARCYNGLGSALFQSAQPERSSADECRWNWDVLTQAQAAFAEALHAPGAEEQESGFVGFRANLGLGEVLFWQSKCPPQPENWELVRGHLAAALEAYDALPVDSQSLLRAEAARLHTYLGHIAPTPRDAAAEYAAILAAAEETGSDELLAQARAVMPWLLSAYCIDGQADKAAAALDELVALLPEPASTRQEIVERLDADLRKACLP